MRVSLIQQGHWSPIVRQMRGSSRPDGMCLVVGSCATGFPPEQNKCALPLSLILTASSLSWLAFICMSQVQAMKTGVFGCI